MRTLQSDQELHKVFELFDPCYRPLDGRLHPVTSGFSGAGVYRFANEQSKYALHINPPHIDVSRIGAISHFLDYLAKEHSLPVPVPVRTRTGLCYGVYRDRLITLELWLSGKPVADQIPDRNTINTVFAFLADLHNAGAKYIPEKIARRWFNSPGRNVSESLGFRYQKLQSIVANGVMVETQSAGNFDTAAQLTHLQQRLTQSVKSWGGPVLQDLQNSRATILPVFPVLRDLWRDHILLHEGQVTGVIDWTSARTDSALTDLTRLCGSLFGNDVECWSHALQAYHDRRPITVDEWNLLGVFDSSNLLLSAVGCWQKLRAVESQQSIRSEKLTVRLKEYLQRLESYQQFCIPARRASRIR